MTLSIHDPMMPTRNRRNQIYCDGHFKTMLRSASILMALYHLFYEVTISSSKQCSNSVSGYTTSSGPSMLERSLLKVGSGKKLREQVVERYFDGVQQQDKDQTVSCFNPLGTKIRDVCGISSGERISTPDELGERCMQFLAAHPDTKVMFYCK